MDINDLYRGILPDVGMKADEEGFISLNLGQSVEEPVLVEGKRLVLPTRVQTSTTNLGNRDVFHPLHENLLRGESEVMTKTRELANAKLNIAFGTIALSLLVLATSPAQQIHLSPDQTVFMDNLKNIDEGIVDTFGKILSTMMTSEDGKRFTRIFVKRSGVLDGRKVQRLAVVTFPLYEELIKPVDKGTPNAVYGVRVNKSEREAMTRLLEYMIPNLGVAEHYNQGSDSTVAPTLDAVLKAVAKLGTVVNQHLDLFGDEIIEQAKEMKYNLEWQDTFQDLRSIQAKINMIPPQPGNEGVLPNASGRPSVAIPDSVVQGKTAQVTDVAPWEDEKPKQTFQNSSSSHFVRPEISATAQPVQQQIRQITPPPAQQQMGHYGHQQRPNQFQPQPQQRPGEGFPGGHNPSMPIQSQNKYLPNYVPPGQGMVNVQMQPGMGGYGYQRMQQGPRPAAFDTAGRPGYSYGNNGGGGFDFSVM